MAPAPEPLRFPKKKGFRNWPDGPASSPLPALPIPQEAMWNPPPSRKFPDDSHVHRHGCSARNITWQYLHRNGTVPRPYADCYLAPVFLTARKCKGGVCVKDQMLQRYMWFDWDGLGSPIQNTTTVDNPASQSLAARSELEADQSTSTLPQEGKPDGPVIADKVTAALLVLFVIFLVIALVKKISRALKNKSVAKRGEPDAEGD